MNKEKMSSERTEKMGKKINAMVKRNINIHHIKHLWENKISNALFVKANIPANRDIVLALRFLHHLSQDRWGVKNQKKYSFANAKQNRSLMHTLS